MDISTNDRNHVWHPYSPLVPGGEELEVVSAKGVYLHTKDGRVIIDAISSWWVNIHGHSHPVLAEAIYTQALELEHVIFAGFTHRPAVTLATNLLEILPNNQTRVFFSDNGSTAVEVGLKMAVQHQKIRGKQGNKIIVLEGSYHGDTFGAMSVSERNRFTTPFADFLFEVLVLPLPTSDNESEVVSLFADWCSKGDVLAFLFEPLVQGAAGMRMYSNETLDTLIQMSQYHQVVTIADEVMTGFGRTGKLFACDHLQNPPDIFCLSKGLTGGALPMGITTCSHTINDSFMSDSPQRTFFHGHSFTANPLACAVALASMKLLLEKSTLENIKRIEQKHLNALPAFATHPGVEKVRTLGTIFAVDVRTSEPTSYFNSEKKNLYMAFLQKNILLRPLGNTIYILPPYVITDDELDHIYETMLEVLDRYKP